MYKDYKVTALNSKIHPRYSSIILDFSPALIGTKHKGITSYNMAKSDAKELASKLLKACKKLK
jgi:hypothetical protein